ncbi:MAG: DNA-formamidopyrimidine glycosylase, partial [Verrucomicrobia bacterium]
MPELAEVEWFRKQWNPGIGAEIVDLTLHAKNRVFRGENVEELQERLIGAKLLTSHTRGKRMLFKFSDNNWIVIHLGMTGKIHVALRDYKPAKRDHLVLYQKDRALVFSDYRQFGRVRFHHGANEPDWWKSEAPEIISPQFDQKFFDSFLD